MITIEYIQKICIDAGIEEEINEQLSFSELGIDSLTIILLLHQIQMDFAITVPWMDIDGKQSIGDFIKTINKLLSGNAV